MRKFLTALFITAVVLTFVGCGGAKIDDAKFVEVWVATYDKIDDEAAYAEALKEYNLTPDDIDAFIKDMLNDEDRLQKITEDMTTKDVGAAFALTIKEALIGLEEGLNL